MQNLNQKCEQFGPAIQNSASVGAALAVQNNQCQELAAVAQLHRPTSAQEQAATVWIPHSVVKMARQSGNFKF